MSEMIERVAKAIYASNAGAWSGTSWEEARGDAPFSNTREAYFREARAAIEAMREPTEEMSAAGQKVNNLSEQAGHFEFLSRDEMAAAWGAMIDAALHSEKVTA